LWSLSPDRPDLRSDFSFSRFSASSRLACIIRRAYALDSSISRS
jgi:hypothetical protein